MTAGLETFAKVRALHDGTTSAGERAAAAGRMEALARAAGMTVAEALSKLDAPSPPPAQGGGFADFFDTPYFREQMAQREEERAVRWREVLAEYGTEEAVFEPGPLEQALDDAHARFGPDPGWNAYPLSEVPSEILATLETASPMPTTVCSAWAEFAFWDKLGSDREARGVGCGDHSPPVQIRFRMLERLLDTLPAASMQDLRARLDWIDWLNTVETAPDPKEERVRLASLRADIERMAVQFGQPTTVGTQAPDCPPAPVQSGQADGVGQPVYPSRRTAADKRRQVLALLNAENAGAAPLTDREIARRVGVSPTTVGTIRRAAGGAAG